MIQSANGQPGDEIDFARGALRVPSQQLPLMNARKIALRLGLVLGGLSSFLPRTQAVEANITDLSSQSMTLREVVFENKSSTLSLKLAGPGSGNSDDVECSLQDAMLKEITRDPATKGDSYRVKVVVTLTDGHQYRGEVGSSLSGESDVGNASVNFQKLAKATFSRAAGDADYVPAAGAIRAQLADKGGNQFEITDVAVSTGNRDQSDSLACSLGEISLSVPLDTITKIENLGEVKQQYSTGTKLRVTLVSGRTLEVTSGTGNKISGPFKYGRVSVPFGALTTATFEKKK